MAPTLRLAPAIMGGMNTNFPVPSSLKIEKIILTLGSHRFLLIRTWTYHNWTLNSLLHKKFSTNDANCKASIWFLELKGLKDLGPKNPMQWICREWIRKLGFNELDNNYSWPRWQECKDKLILLKENHPRHNPRRSVLVYIFFDFDYKSNSCFYSVSLLILRFLSLRVFFYFILSSFFHFHPSCVD